MKIELSKLVVLESLNPRILYGDLEALADDIKENGQLENAKVAYCKSLDWFYLLDGFRRVKSIKLNNGKTVNVEIVAEFEEQPTEREIRDLLYKMALSSNKKKLLDIVDYAIITKNLLQDGLINAEIMSLFGCSAAMITRYTKFSLLDRRTLVAIKTGEIMQVKIIRLFEKNNWNVEETQKDIHSFLENPNEENEVEAIDTEELQIVYTPKQFTEQLQVSGRIKSFAKDIINCWENKDLEGLQEIIYKYLPKKF